MCVFVFEIEIPFLLADIAHILILPVHIFLKPWLSWRKDISIGMHN